MVSERPSLAEAESRTGELEEQADLKHPSGAVRLRTQAA